MLRFSKIMNGGIRLMKISKLEIWLDAYVVSCVLLSLFVYPILEKGDFLVWVLVLYSSPFVIVGKAMTDFMGISPAALQSFIAGLMMVVLIRGCFWGAATIRNSQGSKK